MIPNPALDNPSANGPRFLLANHHRALESACGDLRAAAYVDDPAQLIACYRSFEHAVSEHIAAEEEMVLPAYEIYAPDDARTIASQHAELRKQLFCLGVDVELHCIRLGQLDELIGTLRAHAAHEDRGMYLWAESQLPLRSRRELFVRIRRSLRTLVRTHDRRAAKVAERLHDLAP